MNEDDLGLQDDCDDLEELNLNDYDEEPDELDFSSDRWDKFDN